MVEPEASPDSAKCNTPAVVSAAFLLSVFMFTTAEAARPSDIWVVTDSKHPIEVRAGVRLIELDAPARLDAELAANLPRDPVKAAAVVQQRISEGGPRLRARLAGAYQGVVDAWSLGITKIPAVVVDRQFVVYGEPDVDVAVSKIDQYRRNP